METLTDAKINQDQADQLTGSLELDLVAFFKVLEAEMIEIINSNDDPQVIMSEIDNLLK